MKKIIAVIVLLSFIAGAFAYNSMPDQVASHWDARGQVNGYMDKFSGTFMLPVLIAIVAVALLFLPKIDPLSANIKKFKDNYERFVLVLVLFMVYVYGLTLAWNFYRFDLLQFMSPAFAVLFYSVGELIRNAEQNWTIGIRTPWTLSNETVWKKTHLLGGKLFKAAAVLCLGGVLFPLYAIYFMVAPVLLAAVVSVVYSYLEFRKQNVK